MILLLGVACLTASCRGTTQTASAPPATQPVTPTIVSGLDLAEAVWTNYIAKTNGRTMELWARYTRPVGFPTSAAPVMVWNSNSLITAFTNHTGISQCWEDQGGRGQVPMTLLTRRHAYTRGHHVGAPADGKAHFLPTRIGKRVWFVTPDNRVVEARIANWLTRLGWSEEGEGEQNRNQNRNPDGYCDYSLVVFSEDLPANITPLKVMSPADYRRFILADTNWPRVLLQTEQKGNVSSGHAPFLCDTWKGGDSGSPNLLPVGDGLVFIGGRSTSGPTPLMQADIDALSRSQGLDVRRYGLEWVKPHTN